MSASNPFILNESGTKDNIIILFNQLIDDAPQGGFSL